MKPELANLDALTGLQLRPGLEEALKKQIKRAEYDAEPLALFLIDINHFKSINDAFGHKEGDQVLVDFGRLLLDCIRLSDQAFRVGGDEFVLLLPRTNREQGRAMADRIIRRLAETLVGNSPPINISIRIGIAVYPEDGLSPDVLMEKADQRHYTAKAKGRAVVSEDARPGDQTHLQAISRLIERETAFETFFEFLDGLTANLKGIFQVNSPPGGGKTRFLRELADLGRLRDYVVVHLAGDRYKKVRLFGAVQALKKEFNLVEPILDWAVVILAELKARNIRRLLIIVDDLPEIDSASLDVLGELYSRSDLDQLGIIFSQSQLTNWLSEAPYWTQTTLKPLSLEGVGVWLRLTLKFEPGELIKKQILRLTGGLPGKLLAASAYLQGHGAALGDESAGQWDLWRLEEQLGRGAPVLSNFQPAETSFVNPEIGVDELYQLVLKDHAVTVTGEIGIGKSLLVRQCALEHLADFADGVWLLDGSDAAYPEAAAANIAAVLHLNLQPNLHIENQLLAQLADKKMLFVVDNYDHLLTNNPIFSAIMEACPGIRILSASRQGLGLPGERLVHLGGLLYPPPSVRGKQTLGYSAVQLFIQKAQQHASLREFDEAELSGIGRICTRLDGIPLAIELVSAWTGSLGIGQLVSMVEDSISALAVVKVQIGQPLAAMLWRLFSKQERQALKGLAFLRGSFGLDQAERIADVSLFFLDALCQKAMLKKKGQRYQINELMRDFALPQLENDRRLWRKYSQRFYQEFHQVVLGYPEALKGHNQQMAVQSLALDLQNIWLLLQMTLDRQEWDRLPTLFEVLFRFFEIRSRYIEGQRTFEEVLGRMQTAALHPVAFGLALVFQGWFCGRQRDYARARTLFERGVAELRQTANPAALALALNLYGYLNYYLDGVLGVKLFEESLALLAGLDDPWAKGFAQNYLGICCYNLGDYEKGRLYIRLGLEERRRAGDLVGIANSLNNLGAVTYNAGLYSEARQMLQECLEYHQQIGNQSGIALAFNNLGYVSLFLGDPEACKKYQQQSLTVFERIPDKGGVADALQMLGAAEYALGNTEKADQLLQRALELFQESGLKDRSIETMYHLGYVRWLQKDPDGAAAFWNECIQVDMTEKAIATVTKLLAHSGLAKIEIDHQDYCRAADWLRKAVDYARQANTFYALAQYYYVVVQSLAAIGRNESAAALLEPMLANPERFPEAPLIGAPILAGLAHESGAQAAAPDEVSSPLQWALAFLEARVAPAVEELCAGVGN